MRETYPYKQTPRCHHADPPKMSPEAEQKDTEDRLAALQQRHKCLECGRKIFSEFWMAWSMVHRVAK